MLGCLGPETDPSMVIFWRYLPSVGWLGSGGRKEKVLLQLEHRLSVHAEPSDPGAKTELRASVSLSVVGNDNTHFTSLLWRLNAPILEKWFVQRLVPGHVVRVQEVIPLKKKMGGGGEANTFK